MPSLALDVGVLSSTSGTPQCNGYYILSDLYFPQVYNRIKYPQNRGDKIYHITNMDTSRLVHCNYKDFQFVCAPYNRVTINDKARFCVHHNPAQFCGRHRVHGINTDCGDVDS